ncbi:hypothetical protein BC567DRAFT_266657 [Phyllosticta citribraziliensis]
MARIGFITPEVVIREMAVGVIAMGKQPAFEQFLYFPISYRQYHIDLRKLYVIWAYWVLLEHGLPDGIYLGDFVCFVSPERCKLDLEWTQHHDFSWQRLVGFWQWFPNLLCHFRTWCQRNELYRCTFHILHSHFVHLLPGNRFRVSPIRLYHERARRNDDFRKHVFFAILLNDLSASTGISSFVSGNFSFTGSPTGVSTQSFSSSAISSSLSGSETASGISNSLSGSQSTTGGNSVSTGLGGNGTASFTGLPSQSASVSGISNSLSVSQTASTGLGGNGTASFTGLPSQSASVSGASNSLSVSQTASTGLGGNGTASFTGLPSQSTSISGASNSLSTSQTASGITGLSSVGSVSFTGVPSQSASDSGVSSPLSASGSISGSLSATTAASLTASGSGLVPTGSSSLSTGLGGNSSVSITTGSITATSQGRPVMSTATGPTYTTPLPALVNARRLYAPAATQPCFPPTNYTGASFGRFTGVNDTVSGRAACEGACTELGNCFDVYYIHYTGDATNPQGYYDCYYGGTNPEDVECGNCTIPMRVRRQIRGGSSIRGRHVVGAPDSGRAFNADRILQKMGIKAPGLEKRQNPEIDYDSPNACVRVPDSAEYALRIIPSGDSTVTAPATTAPPSIITSRITDLVTVTTTQTITITSTLTTGGTTIITTIITTVCSTGTVLSGTTSWTSSTPASISATATASATLSNGSAAVSNSVSSSAGGGSFTALPLSSTTASVCPTDAITSVETVWVTPSRTAVPRMFRAIAV